jgi:hypothetical protein
VGLKEGAVAVPGPNRDEPPTSPPAAPIRHSLAAARVAGAGSKGTRHAAARPPGPPPTVAAASVSRAPKPMSSDCHLCGHGIGSLAGGDGEEAAAGVVRRILDLEGRGLRRHELAEEDGLCRLIRAKPIPLYDSCADELGQLGPLVPSQCRPMRRKCLGLFFFTGKKSPTVKPVQDVREKNTWAHRSLLLCC